MAAITRLLPWGVPGRKYGAFTGRSPALWPYVQQVATPRTPAFVVVLTLDTCSLTFGVAPCTATGTKCWNTWGTCKDLTNFARTTKDYQFSSADVPAWINGVRPYVNKVGLKSTEIKDTLTVSSQVDVDFLDEPDRDVDGDPYLTTRTAFPDIPGTFWRRLVSRVPNYRGRPLKVYEGFKGDALGAMSLIWSGNIDSVALGRGSCRVTAKDVLRDLAK